MKIPNVYKNIIILLFIWYLGYVIHFFFPLAPVVINSFILTFLFLLIGFIKESSLKVSEEIFVPIIGVFFIPSGVKIYFLWPQIQEHFIRFLCFLTLSFFLVFAVTFLTAKFLIHYFQRSRD